MPVKRSVMAAILLSFFSFNGSKAAAPVAKATAIPESDYDSYCNQRYGYCIDYPAGVLNPRPEAGNGDGRVFTDQYGNEVLRIYGRGNTDPDFGKVSLKQEMEDDIAAFIKAAGGKKDAVTYRKLGKDFFVFSGVKNGMICYQKTIICGEDLAFAEFQYPQERRSAYNDIVTKMSASFRAPVNNEQDAEP